MSKNLLKKCLFRFSSKNILNTSSVTVKTANDASCPPTAVDTKVVCTEKEERHNPDILLKEVKVKKSVEEKESCVQNEPEKVAVNDNTLVVSEPPDEATDLFYEILHGQQFLGITAELYLFIQDRAERLCESIDNDIQWIVEAVDFLDELQIMKNSYTAKDIMAVDYIRNIILAKLTALETELIDSDEWNPALQRAISVTKDAAIVQEKILRKRSSGIIVSGKLIRKQEVVLLIPQAKGEKNV